MFKWLLSCYFGGSTFYEEVYYLDLFLSIDFVLESAFKEIKKSYSFLYSSEDNVEVS